jgi:hypothetical protein
MYVVLQCIRFGHVFPLSVDLLGVEFIDRQHHIAILESVQDFPHPILQMLPVLCFGGPAPHHGEAMGLAEERVRISAPRWVMCKV